MDKQLLMMSWVLVFLQHFFSIATLADDFTAENAAELIAAINQANANGVTDTITLTDNITLVAVDNVVEGNNGLPLVTSVLTIEGQGFTIQRSPAAGTEAFRIFYVAPTGRLTLHQVAIANGLASLATSASAAGGGLFNRGTLTLVDSEVLNHVAESAGGGIFNADGGNLHIQQSTLSDNASVDGGAIWTGTAMLTISASVLSNNSASLSGGAVFCLDTTAKISRTTLSGNTAELGGGIASRCSLTIESSTLSGNSAAFGGGIHAAILNLDVLMG